AVEVEDAQGVWRVEPQNAFPPLDANWTTLYISADGSLGSEPGESGSFPLAPLVGYGGLAHRMGAPSAPMSRIHFETEPLAEDLRLSGMPRVHLTAIPSGPGGHLFATLYDYDGKTETRIGHAAMDLRFAAGDGQMRPVVPGMPLEVKMELFALDYLVAKGHSIHLVISQESEGEPGLDPIPNPSGGIIRVTVGGDALSEVHLPVIVRDQSAFDLGWKPLVKTDADEAGGA
ncbi:MAG TPA: CocE/NonD family hydrolase C-terminal non-catalytic domain-containing protein, partial [Candidatus Thermoplasmatota archaeon]|nr:CocE/NonD family hydrolase C-terminal non-catalytic domain-containing protein [Candidatus Thermoplasmatota archaeon]